MLMKHNGPEGSRLNCWCTLLRKTAVNIVVNFSNYRWHRKSFPHWVVYVWLSWPFHTRKRSKREHHGVFRPIFDAPKLQCTVRQSRDRVQNCVGRTLHISIPKQCGVVAPCKQPHRFKRRRLSDPVYACDEIDAREMGEGQAVYASIADGLETVQECHLKPPAVHRPRHGRGRRGYISTGYQIRLRDGFRPFKTPSAAPAGPAAGPVPANLPAPRAPAARGVRGRGRSG